MTPALTGLNEEQVDAHREEHGKNVVIKGKKEERLGSAFSFPSSIHSPSSFGLGCREFPHRLHLAAPDR
jgi:hypothetical protein